MSNESVAKVSFTGQPSAVDFHPSNDMLCVGSMDAKVEVYKWERSQADEGFIQLVDGWQVDFEDEQHIRAVAFASGGQKLITGCSLGEIHVYDTATGKVITEEFEEDDECGAYSIQLLDANTFAVGHDDGIVNLWDMRESSLSRRIQFNKQEDYISDMCHNTRASCLAATSGDGTLAVYDLRKNKLKQRSEEDADDELLSCTMCKGNSKLVSGSQEGVINLFSWGHFADCSDRYPGHPDSIDCILPIDDDTILTGCGDGIVRLVSVLPNKIEKELCSLGEDEHVHCLSISSCKSIVAACGDSNYLSLWLMDSLVADTNQEQFNEYDEEDDSDSEEKQHSSKKRRRAKKTGAKHAKKTKDNSFFSDLL